MYKYEIVSHTRVGPGLEACFQRTILSAADHKAVQPACIDLYVQHECTGGPTRMASRNTVLTKATLQCLRASIHWQATWIRLRREAIDCRHKLDIRCWTVSNRTRTGSPPCTVKVNLTMGGEAADAHLSAYNVMYTDSVSSWLRVHGKAVRPQLDKRQLDALRECFDIIDTDGTGMITAGELCSVFTASLSPARCAPAFSEPGSGRQAPHIYRAAPASI